MAKIEIEMYETCVFCGKNLSEEDKIPWVGGTMMKHMFVLHFMCQHCGCENTFTFTNKEGTHLSEINLHKQLLNEGFHYFRPGSRIEKLPESNSFYRDCTGIKWVGCGFRKEPEE